MLADDLTGDSPRVLRAARRWGGALLDVAFPAACVACGAATAERPEAERDFCEVCAAAIAPPAGTVACLRCATPRADRAVIAPATDCPACRGEKWAFDATVALGPYEGLLRRLVLDAKRPGRDRLAGALGRRLAVRVATRGLEGPTVIVPTPSHWWRRFVRGANSPDAIAAGLASDLRAPLRNALRRTRYTAKQADMAPSRRRTNVRGCFASRGSGVAGHTVLLVDDVLTTGATLNAAARALRSGGASRVVAVVVARRVGG
ncbi:MAG: phosphoribosyltransferase family protein [Lacipirellulaceae bacterium]